MFAIRDAIFNALIGTLLLGTGFLGFHLFFSFLLNMILIGFFYMIRVL